MERLRRALAGDDTPSRAGLPINELLAPGPLLALIVLGINDWVLKGSSAPVWLTGKLSDFAGLFVFPLVATAAFDLVLMMFRGRVDYTFRRWKLAVACLLTGVGFAVLKLWPAGSDFLVHAMRTVARRSEVYMDPTDLIALVMLPLAWWHGRRVLARGAYGRLAWASRRGVTAPFADAVACGASPSVVEALHAALARGDTAAVASSLDELRR